MKIENLKLEFPYSGAICHEPLLYFSFNRPSGEKRHLAVSFVDVTDPVDIAEALEKIAQRLREEGARDG